MEAQFPPFVLNSRGSLDQYEIIDQVGQGTYGRVYKAHRKSSKTVVALKVIAVQTGRSSPPKEGQSSSLDGVTFTAIREINNLAQLDKSRNVVNMLDAFLTSSGELVIVLEYFDFDLVGLIASCPDITSLPHIKWFFRQAVEAVHQCHSSGLMHRDIKAANLLVNHNHELKLTDLGLMTTFDDVRMHHSQNVVTLWYRSPELLLGDSLYGPAVDLWSLGCVLVELFTKKSPFPGTSEAHQLELICKLCGTPTEETYPNVSQTPGYRKMLANRPQLPRTLADNLRAALPADALDLLERLFCLDPRRRIRAQEVLRHPFLNSAPAPAPPPPLRYDSVHEFELRNRKRLVDRGSAEAQKRPRPAVSVSGSAADTSPPASYSAPSSFNSATAYSPHASASTRMPLGSSASGSNSSLPRNSTPHAQSPKVPVLTTQSPATRLTHSLSSPQPHKRTSPPTASGGRSPQPRLQPPSSSASTTPLAPTPAPAPSPAPASSAVPVVALPPPPPVVVPAGHSANAYLAPAKRKQPASSLVRAAS